MSAGKEAPIPAVCTARRGMTLSGHPAPFVLDGDGFQQCGGRPLWMFADILTSARCTQISRWMARRFGSSAMWLWPGSNLSRENPRSLTSPPFKIRCFFADSCKRPVGAYKLSSAPKGRNASLSSSQTLKYPSVCPTRCTHPRPCYSITPCRY